MDKEIKVGQGVTITFYTDRVPGTIVAVEGNIITIAEDDYVRVDNNGMSDCQEYEYTTNPNNQKYFARIEKDGRIQAVTKNSHTNRWNKTDSFRVGVGFRRAYYDFSF